MARIAVPLRFLGYRNLEVAEEIAQDTLLRAFQVWSIRGTPPSPEAWLMTCAKNLALDFLRSNRRRLKLSTEMKRTLFDTARLESTLLREFDPSRIQDDLLRMVFSCCDPRLTVADQVEPTLHFACGLSAAEIGSSLLISNEAVRKRLFRARKYFRETGTVAIVTWSDGLLERLDAVLQVIYLLFAEGYKSTHGKPVIRFDLCAEALRLGAQLIESPLCRKPKTHGLIALLFFKPHGCLPGSSGTVPYANFNTRTGASGTGI